MSRHTLIDLSGFGVAAIASPLYTQGLKNRAAVRGGKDDLPPPRSSSVVVVGAREETLCRGSHLSLLNKLRTDLPGKSVH